MNNHIEAAAIDLDDTLLRPDHTVSEYTIDVLRRVQEKGVRLVIATGRMFQAARPYAKKIGLPDVPMIVYNGSMVARCGSGEIIYQDPVSLSAAREIIQVAADHHWYIQVYIDDELYVPFRDERTDRYEHNCGVKATVLGDKLKDITREPIKLLIFETDPAVMAEVERTMRDRFTGRVGFVYSDPTFFEMQEIHSSKGHALETLCLSWGISRDHIMTFGNGENDASMLAMTPWSFAVANAADKAKEAARFVTGSNAEDGVAHALEKYILNE
jgi:Cof subfamily protein (haloacid dehalogenase superfamily)